MRILIGYDGSECADFAIDDLRRAGLPARGIEATVLSVADVWPELPASAFQGTSSSADSGSQIVRRAHELARLALEDAKGAAAAGKARLAAMFPEWTIHADSCGESPAGALIARAQQWNADLIVVGSEGRSALGRALLGSVSRDVLEHAPCSVRIGRKPRHAANEPIRLFVGIDGSTSAATAVSAVASRTWPARTTVYVATALDIRIATALAFAAPQPMAPFPAPTAQPSEEQWATEAVEAVAAELRRAGLTAITIVRPGDPKRVLLDEAEKCGADCIVVGAKGMSRVERFLLGSVSSAVAARAGCSVEVVRVPT